MGQVRSDVNAGRRNVVSVSGGKDSLATWLVALETEDRATVLPLFADTGNEDPITYDYLDLLESRLGQRIERVRRDFSKEIAAKRDYVLNMWPGKGVPAQVVERAAAALVPSGNPYLDLCLWKGRFPSRRAQFCTQFLKRDPLTERALELIDGGEAVWSWQGVRADESPGRARLASFEVVGGDLYINRPILRWSAQDCIDAARYYGVESNPLYKLGMSRVGCMPCINATKGEILEISKRFPEHIDRIEQWERAVQEASKRSDSSFFADPLEDAHLNKRGIRKVVLWSQTSYGGKQFSLFAQQQAQACSSAYGLCE